MAFERVYSVTDDWDGPREGVADYRGTPHAYRSVFRQGEGDWDEERYYLKPLTPEEAALAQADWAIWQRFVAHYRGRVAPMPDDRDDWGALPADVVRRRALRALLVPVFTLDASRCHIARATFQRADAGAPRQTGHGPLAPDLVVQWDDAAAQDGDVLVPSTAA